MANAQEGKTDFRASRMPTSEGHGRARTEALRAWGAYQRAVKKVAEPIVRPIAREGAGATVVDLVGFWLLWQLEGGFEGLLGLGMSRASVYRRVSLFRKSFGAHPDDFEFPGVTVDVDAYLRGLGRDRSGDTPPDSKSQTTDK